MGAGYRMEGANADWVDAAADWMATSANPPAGQYAFRERGPSGLGAEAIVGGGAVPATQAWWLRVLYAVLAAGLTAAVAWWLLRTRHVDDDPSDAVAAPDPAGEVGIAAVSVLPSVDAVFLKQVQDAVEAAMGDETFTVGRLAEDLDLSRGHLHRRLATLRGQTPSEVIREMRLDRAARLLSSGVRTVSEVAYAVGFKSASHFSNSFAARFGCRPSAYAQVPESWTGETARLHV